MTEHQQPSRPLIAIQRLHLRGLRGLDALDLPEDGLGWNGAFPPVAMIAGENGSGKTTLLRFIALAFRYIADPGPYPRDMLPAQCRMDVVLQDGQTTHLTTRFVVGDQPFFDASRTQETWGYVLKPGFPGRQSLGTLRTVKEALHPATSFGRSSWPRVVLLPSEDRDLIVPAQPSKGFSPLHDPHGFVVVWERPKEWSGSLMELLFSARWADLNARDKGLPAEHFARYTQAFSELTGGRKRLDWTAGGELVVAIGDEITHPIEQLSSGERQALLLLAELRRLWRPGSLILIDELELHLHDAWQGRLYEIICGMQRELGGQVLITTQSQALFEMADTGTRLVLGRRRRSTP